ELTLAVGLGVIDAVVDHPELVGLWVDIDTVDHPNAADDAVGIATPLASHGLDLACVALIEHGVIEEEVAFVAGLELVLDLLPDQARGDLLASEIAVDRVVAPLLGVLGEVGEGVVDLSRDQELAVVESGESFGTVAHSIRRTGFSLRGSVALNHSFA